MMKATTNISETKMVSPFYTFWIIHTMQAGVGILGFQKYVSETTGNDAWISVFAVGFLVNLMIFLIYSMLNKQQGDLVDVHKTYFGKVIGGVFSFIFAVYFFAITIVVLRTYTEVVQVWMFPGLDTWAFTLVFLILTYYIVSGGFRTVVGICFFGVALPFWLIIILFFNIPYSNFKEILPIFNHPIKDLLIGMKVSILGYLGFSSLFMFYPFIKHAEKSQKWAQIAALLTTVVYTLIMILSLAFFSEGQLKILYWGTLSLVKYVQFPFLERMEYIYIAFWLLIILPNIVMYIWCASRCLKKITPLKQKTALIILLFFIWIICISLDTRKEISMLNENATKIGMYIEFVYVPILFIIVKLFKKKGDTKK